MTKKLYLIFFIILLIGSCGKKGDPVYKEKSSKIFDTKIKMVL